MDPFQKDGERRVCLFIRDKVFKICTFFFLTRQNNLHVDLRHVKRSLTDDQMMISFEVTRKH